MDEIDGIFLESAILAIASLRARTNRSPQDHSACASPAAILGGIERKKPDAPRHAELRKAR
jgi:hypothetical protein